MSGRPKLMPAYPSAGGGGLSAAKIVLFVLVGLLLAVTISTLGVGIADLVKKDKTTVSEATVEVSSNQGITEKNVVRNGEVIMRIIEADIGGIGTGPSGCMFAEAATRDLSTSAFWIEAGANFADDPTLRYLANNRDILASRWDFLGMGGKSRPIPGFGGRTQELQTSNVAGGGAYINNANVVGASQGYMDRIYAMSGNNANLHPNKFKAAKKAIETFHPINGVLNSARGGSGPIHIMEVPLAGPTAVAEQFATALTAVTGLDTIDDHTISTYGFNKKWQMFGTPDGRRSYGLTEDMGILNASVVTRCGADYCGVNGRKLKVWTNSKATRLDWDLSGPIPRCIGFSFVRNGMSYVFRARKAVSLNAGLYSMRLLQVSGVGDASILAPVGIQVVANVPNVGRRGSNHVAYGYTLTSPSGARATDPTNGNFTCTMGGFLPNPLDTSDTRRGIQYIIQDGNSAANTPVTTVKALTVFNLHPSSRGYQHPLSPSIDGPWNVYYGYFDNTTDIDVLVAFHNQTILPLKAYMDAHQDVWAGWAWTNPSPSVMADLTQMRAFIIANARHAHHGCEYTLMAPCDQGGVVDPNTGAVCGVAGLFHVDTSVIPQPDGNNEHYVLAYSSIFSQLAVDNDWNFW